MIIERGIIEGRDNRGGGVMEGGTIEGITVCVKGGIIKRSDDSERENRE